MNVNAENNLIRCKEAELQNCTPASILLTLSKLVKKKQIPLLTKEYIEII
jgi:hypothetical protein